MPPLRVLALTLSLATLWVCCIMLQCSGAGSGDPFGVPLMGHDTPSAVLHMDMAFPGVKGPLGSPAQWRMSIHCLSAETFSPYTQTPPPSPPLVGVCAGLAADKPGAVASTPEGACLGPAVDALPDALNNSVTFLISVP